MTLPDTLGRRNCYAGASARRRWDGASGAACGVNLAHGASGVRHGEPGGERLRLGQHPRFRSYHVINQRLPSRDKSEAALRVGSVAAGRDPRPATRDPGRNQRPEPPEPPEPPGPAWTFVECPVQPGHLSGSEL